MGKKTPEGRITAILTKMLEHDGAIVIPTVAGQLQSGWPDRVVYHRRWHGLMEIKANSNRLTPRQAHNLTKLRRRRPTGAYVIRGVVIDDDVTWSVEDELGVTLGQFVDVTGLLAICAGEG